MFASRAGEKLEYALNQFQIDISGRVCADFGCSTGGFTDCLLRQGAVKVFAVDTGYGVLDWKLRQDPRVIVMERTNALFLTLPERVDFISIDVGWTRQKLIMPVALNWLNPGGNIVSLLKPHYEARQDQLSHGVVKPDEIPNVVNNVITQLESLDIIPRAEVRSPVVGEKGGNTEFLLWFNRD